MKDNQYELGEPRQVGKRLIGRKFYNQFQLVKTSEKSRITLELRWAFLEYYWYYHSGICWFCGRGVGEKCLERGHLIDRVCGGIDDITNMRPSCWVCNHILKPFCDSLEDVYKWRNRLQSFLIHQIEAGKDAYITHQVLELTRNNEDNKAIIVNFHNQKGDTRLFIGEDRIPCKEWIENILDNFHCILREKYGNKGLI